MKKISALQKIVAPSQSTIAEIMAQLPGLKSETSSQHKILQFMASTLDSLNATMRNSALKIERIERPRVSVVPLSREKLRVVTHRRQLNSRLTLFNRTAENSPLKNKMQNEANRPYIQFFTKMSFINNKLKRKSFKVEVLIDELKVYFSNKKQKEWSAQITSILNIQLQLRRFVVGNDVGQLKYETVKKCNGQLSKLFFNICYQIYLYKKNKQNVSILAIIHSDIEYYSRRLRMLNLTMICCMDVGRIYCQYFELEKAALEFNKVIKLAVFLNDKYLEELAIDRLGMCQYYSGDISSANFLHNSRGKLGVYDKLRIQQNYSNEKEIQIILSEKTKQKTENDDLKYEFFRNNKENIGFNFDGATKDNHYVQNNYETFRNNVKDIIKVDHLRKKVPLIKRALHKVDMIGSKAYCGKGYVLPKASKFQSNTIESSREEVLMTHRSHNRNGVNNQIIKIDRFCKMIEQILNFFTTQQNRKENRIKEESQSYISDDYL